MASYSASIRRQRWVTERRLYKAFSDYHHRTCCTAVPGRWWAMTECVR
ncbi:hypothetical protein M758_9G056200 [Ceratodon purpureus]|nr:hypothetical protein M758_9G056200 [Ceratodon purpureus]